ncbi:MAG: carboxypeptidase-like regulatory domain-containing protein [Terracidiphilus sp.]
MKGRLGWLGFLLVALALAPPARAVYETVVIERPFHARSLAGVVLDPSGAPIPAATVEDRDPKTKQVLATATTDANGRFRFPRAKLGSVHTLYVLARGFDPLQVTVKIRLVARGGLKLRLRIGG